jgi:GMP synthase-like glutamine amidotransferase
MEHSPTFAYLVEQLQATDLVAIVQPSATMSLSLSGYLTFVSHTSACRYVRIKFTTRYNGAQAIGIIAHELQHAVEVGLHPEVTDAETLRALYSTRGTAVDADR